MTPATRTQSALIDALRAELGAARVTSCLDAGDPDPRTAHHVSGRLIGEPCCWVRPEGTAHCAAVVRLARAHGASVCPVGEATTFWDGLRVGGAVALDVTSLRAPPAVDPARRLVWAGAGCSVRAVDRAARAHGLCLVAYPDTAGDTPIGTLVAVGSTAGLGLGRALPVEQVTGATVVLGTGEIVRAGAGHALGGAPFLRHGLPDLLGLLTAAEGRAALLTAVGLALAPAPFAVRGRARRRLERAPDEGMLLDLLAVARRALDRGSLDTFRVELGASDGDDGLGWEVMFQSSSPRDPADARQEAAPVGEAVAAILGVPVVIEAETERARAGELPEYDARFDVPPGQHRQRMQGGAFWGAEVAASWGADLRACLAQLLALHHDLAAAAPHHRRLGLYPASHSVSAGVQVRGRREPERVAHVVAILSAALPALLATGAVPYRTGGLWRRAVATRLESLGEVDPTVVTERCLRALDPDGVLPGPQGRALGSDLADADEGSTARRERVARALREAHPDLVAGEDDASLELPVAGARVTLALGPAGVARAQVQGRHLSLHYRVEGALTPNHAALARARLLRIAETFLRIEAAPRGAADAATELEGRVDLARSSTPPAEVRLPARLLADPSLLGAAVDRLRRAELDGAPVVTLANLPPCLDTALRPEPRQAPVAAVIMPLVAPCRACGAAMYCPASAVPRADPVHPLRILRHHDATAAALAAIHAVADAWQRPVPAAALEAILSLFGARAGALGVPPVPLELSLKRSAAALLPHLRVVEYSPRARPGLPAREERAPLRRAGLIDLARTLGAPEARGWVEALEAEQPSGMELSFGLDADLDSGRVVPQLYAHVEPRDRPRMLGALRRALAWSGAEGPVVPAIVALATGAGEAAEAAPSDVVLIALSPTPSAPRRIKIYFSRRLADGHAPSGLQAADLGPLQAMAPERGLAVLSCEPRGVHWEKWDFPCATHYQRAEGLAEAFTHGLPDAERARGERLLDGRRFAVWPTWLSVGASGSTLYFIPR